MDEAELNVALKELNKTLHEKRARVKRLQEEVDLYHTKQANLGFVLERERARKKSRWWMLLILLIFALKCTALRAGNYGVFVLCEYAFLSCWRSLFVRENKHTTPVAVCCVAIALYYL